MSCEYLDHTFDRIDEDLCEGKFLRVFSHRYGFFDTKNQVSETNDTTYGVTGIATCKSRQIKICVNGYLKGKELTIISKLIVNGWSQ